MKKMLLATVASTALFSTFGLGSASADYACTGNVSALMVGPSGGVTASITSATSTLSGVYLCMVNQTYNGVTAESCRAIYSTLLTAITAARPVRVYFNDALSCTTHPVWTMLTGWYNGPELY